MGAAMGRAQSGHKTKLQTDPERSGCLRGHKKQRTGTPVRCFLFGLRTGSAADFSFVSDCPSFPTVLRFRLSFVSDLLFGSSAFMRQIRSSYAFRMLNFLLYLLCTLRSKEDTQQFQAEINGKAQSPTGGQVA